MEEKRNYVVYTNGNGGCYGIEEQEHIVKMSAIQADAIRWFMENFDIDGCVEFAENYKGEEI
jgi:hypothetical protein